MDLVEQDGISKEWDVINTSLVMAESADSTRCWTYYRWNARRPGALTGGKPTTMKEGYSAALQLVTMGEMGVEGSEWGESHTLSGRDESDSTGELFACMGGLAEADM